MATAEVLQDVIRLHALCRVEADLAWLMAEELLEVSAGKQVPELIRCEHVAAEDLLRDNRPVRVRVSSVHALTKVVE